MSKQLEQTEGKFKLLGNIKKFAEDKNIRSADNGSWTSLNIQVDTGDDSPNVSVMGFKPDAKREVTIFKVKDGKTEKVKVKATEVAKEIKKYPASDGWQVGGGVRIRVVKRDKETGELIKTKDGKNAYTEFSLPNHLALTQLKNLLNKNFNRDDAKPMGVAVSGDISTYVDKNDNTRTNYNLKSITFLENPFTKEDFDKKQVSAFVVSGVYDSASELPDGRVSLSLRHIDFREQVTVGNYIIDANSEDERIQKIANTLLNAVDFGAFIKLEGRIINRPNIVSTPAKVEDDFADMFGDFSDEASEFERPNYDGFLSELHVTRVLEFARDVYTEDDFIKEELDTEDMFESGGGDGEGEDDDLFG